MSGDDDRRGAKPLSNPFLDDAGAPRALPRARRHKPPPGIITAGGVDMARAHASGIRVRAAAAPAIVPDEPRVVLAVETDPRKVPTHKRLLEGRDDDGTRAALLPATPGEETLAPRPRSSAPPPPVIAREPALPRWMRIALVASILLLTFVVLRRLWPAPRPPLTLAVTASISTSPLASITPPSPPPSAPPPASITPPASHAAPIEEPRAPRPRPAPAAPRAPAIIDAAAPAKAPPPKPDFQPPFQLPGEDTDPR